ncbi:conserved hypothetical protein [Microcystis aeruginosa PCC 9809]|jgi:hypothetical protein|uniref:DUF1995 domain-containing protein n=4 Tax=Microcystis aeruginosa TaxID=1126 RepID=I4HJC2_MICAE|nr:MULTISPECIES: DUF1995 family protein [Microcystis]REJ50348.1 MAG: DUF1995 family protein [Microcystis flos-aquae DF17]MCZ8117815.1 DUF1995 family protein [Microcystis sp. LE18-22.4A]OPF18732.1 hypothetical protein B1L04_04530 [Microcystis aeruginosa KW]CCI22146.1 conserved hypothetical protein [Microcystis aeruginosa PCC 9809]BAG04900.1 hypothetical protein MAE_50780 [Microcystis aeruginosa NIES-843]
MTLPNSLEETILQAKAATQLALESGDRRIQVELVIPEIALQAQALALDFTSIFDSYGSGLRVIFPDTGAAMLARRDWGETVFQLGDLGSRFIPIENKIKPEDEAFLVVCPSSVEINSVEKLCNLAEDRPVVLLIPQLEDVSVVGIGYAARQLRERFLSTLESCYYFRPLESAIVYRSYPSLWQVWLEKEDGYELISEQSTKPMGEALENLILKASSNTPNDSSNPANKAKKSGLFATMGRFLKALQQ